MRGEKRREESARSDNLLEALFGLNPRHEEARVSSERVLPRHQRWRAKHTYCNELNRGQREMFYLSSLL